MSDALLARLEAILPALEKLAATVDLGDDDSKTARIVEDYDAVYASAIKPWIETCKTLKFEWATDTETAFTHLRKVFAATAVCKKPTQSELMQFCKPIVDVVSKTNSIDNRSPVFDEHKAWAEIMALFNFLFSPTPVATVSACLESAEFYFNKTLVKAKDKPDAEKQHVRNYVSQAKTLIMEMTEFVKSNAKMGLAWNAQGGDISSFGGPAASAPRAPPAPKITAPVPPPVSAAKVAAASSAAKATGGMGAVFAELNKGGSVTAGLRKVTKDMKTKNMPKAEPLQPKPKAAPVKPVETKTAAVKKEPKTARQKGTWFVENYVDTNETISGVEMKENIFISGCTGATFIIDCPKFKSLTINNCKKVQIQFSAVVSTCEIINCIRAKIFVMQACPVVTIDKSTGSTIVLTKESVTTAPQIFSAQSSETNVSIPGATDEADPVEIALPEQFVSDFKDGTYATVPAVHHD